ncbi:hypothetical protein AHF37_11092 [Paragonimus kellicotti]|nr:hypothetical protein AHF37_11092 [Paragonimus kellicotti]
MYSASTFHLYGWGACEDNQFGSRNEGCEYVMSPQKIDVGICGNIVSISCGYKHTLILNADGEVFSCGGNEYGQLGRSGSSNLGRISALESHTITDIACGAYHNAAISYTGRLYTWGCNSNGQLGREGDDCSVKMIRSLSEHRIVQVSLGLEHSLVLTDTSRVFTFGSNLWGQLGLGFRSDNPVPVPQQILCLAGLPVRSVCAGGMHSVLITISGHIYVWGGNKYGQLGLGPLDSSDIVSETGSRVQSRSSVDSAQLHSVSVPTEVRSLRDQKIVFVDCGEAHTVVLTQDGRVLSYGSNQ